MHANAVAVRNVVYVCDVDCTIHTYSSDFVSHIGNCQILEFGKCIGGVVVIVAVGFYFTNHLYSKTIQNRKGRPTKYLNKPKNNAKQHNQWQTTTATATTVTKQKPIRIVHRTEKGNYDIEKLYDEKIVRILMMKTVVICCVDYGLSFLCFDYRLSRTFDNIYSYTHTRIHTPNKHAFC